MATIIYTSKMGLKNSFIPLIVPSIAAPAVFFFMKQYLDASLPMEIVEAARMDGASKWQQIRNVTLPNLVPTAITLFILSVGKIFFSDFGLFYQVPRNSGMLFSATQTIDTYVYNALMVNNNIALSSAASVLQSLCGVVCILLANWVVRKISEENAMF